MTTSSWCSRDTPLVEPAALVAARDKLADGAAVVVIGFRTPNPTGYGRLIEKDGELVAIREERDCSAEEKKIDFCNGGLMAIDGRHRARAARRGRQRQCQGRILSHRHRRDRASQGPQGRRHRGAASSSVLGINNRVELAEAEAIWQNRKRREMMLAGVTMIQPETVVFAYDTVIGPDTVLEPDVFFAPGVKVAANARIRAYSHLEGASVGPNAEVGPFARLRPGAELAEKSKVGNFCEVKKAKVGAGAKVNHLTYIGDAVIGAQANIGAGTITCNYDGFNKFVTEIGAGAFIGSNSALVAPVKIGDGAYVASGSVITENVPDDALAFGRARQKTLPERGQATARKTGFSREKVSESSNGFSIALWQSCSRLGPCRVTRNDIECDFRARRTLPKKPLGRRDGVNQGWR